MGVSFKPIYNRNNTKTKGGIHTIHLRVTIDRESKYFNLNLPKIKKEYWAGRENKWIKDTHPQNHLFNKAIMDRISDLQAHVNKLFFLNKPITFNKLREFFERRGDKESFNDYIDYYLANIKFGSENTRKKYNTFKKHLNKFNPKIKFNELEESLFFEYRDYLLKKGLVGSTVIKYFNPFKKIIKHALKNDYLIRDPFYEVKLDIQESVVDRNPLSVNEIQEILNLTFEKKGEEYLELHRDIFVFECLSGLYYSDVQGLTPDNLQETEAGIVLVGKRFKNDFRYVVPLYKFPDALRLIEKYKGSGDNLFPTVTEQAFNRALKIIGSMAEIKKKLYNKVGRHTFCELLISKGYTAEYVAKMAGHQDPKTTKRYFELSTSHVVNELVNFEPIVFENGLK